MVDPMLSVPAADLPAFFRGVKLALSGFRDGQSLINQFVDAETKCLNDLKSSPTAQADVRGLLYEIRSCLHWGLLSEDSGVVSLFEFIAETSRNGWTDPFRDDRVGKLTLSRTLACRIQPPQWLCSRQSDCPQRPQLHIRPRRPHY